MIIVLKQNKPHTHTTTLSAVLLEIYSGVTVPNITKIG